MENHVKRAILNRDKFCVFWELVPGRGAREVSQEKVLLLAEQAAQSNKVDALTITDNPGGNPGILADYLGMEILKKGIEAVVHFTCKDKNRNQIESQLYALDRAGVRNLLVMTGDYPVTGFQGRPRPVFDLDSVHVLDLIEKMNAGLEYPGIKSTVKHSPSDFFAGAAVSPFKKTEAEQIIQYLKLKKKITNGAKFIITQVGYDGRKFHELLQFVKLSGLNVSLIGNIYILPYGTAKIMNANKIPGCVVTDKLLAEIEEERNAPDKGKGARLLRAAKMYAILKGMGYQGVHLGGNNISYQDIEYVIDKGEELTPNWLELVPEFDYPQDNGFYYFVKDEKTGLNSEKTINREGLPLDTPVDFSYRISRLMHKLMFEPNKKLFGPMRGISKRIQGTSLEKAFHKFEHFNKVLLYDCKDCGDCALPDLAYICPMSQCPKNQRNGACEGSFDGWCEVYPNKKKCVWVKAYSRLKKYGEESQLAKDIEPPLNWDSYQTSSWINYYLGYDHSAKRLGITRIPKKNK
ncbi:MAG: methylenetetrahydrofolate reductase C-terminal domain-containing protein [Peptococcales bacterium]|jgi:methylenetetrahydrofolate reductase (NADPH)